MLKTVKFTGARSALSPLRRRIAGAAPPSQYEDSELASTWINLHQPCELRHMPPPYPSDPKRFETRSLPALSRSYPRHFTFHVAHPVRSIQRTGLGRLGGLQSFLPLGC